jgi:hypothetical protein
MLAWLLLAVAPFTHEAYIWQRAWDESVRIAIEQSHTNLTGYIALAAEVSFRTGQPEITRIALHDCGAPVALALRVGPLGTNTAPANLLADLAGTLVAGFSARELQIDFDCAESKLDDYRAWVEVVRRRVAPVPVTITTLPVWLRHPEEFRRLVAATDGFVLQVHSLERPANAAAPLTLCDPDAARQAVATAAKFGKPFRVALPTYGYVVGFNAAGKFLGISAEGPSLTWPVGSTLREVRADPAALATLVREWSAKPVTNLTGIIWYRLPTEKDRLNWHWPTLAAVMAGRAPLPALAVETRRPEAGLVELELVNRGEADTSGNAVVTARWRGATLLACDALAGFDKSGSGTNETRFMGNPRLAPGQRRTIGWLRFKEVKEVECEAVVQ